MCSPATSARRRRSSPRCGGFAGWRHGGQRTRRDGPRPEGSATASASAERCIPVISEAGRYTLGAARASGRERGHTCGGATGTRTRFLLARPALRYKRNRPSDHRRYRHDSRLNHRLHRCRPGLLSLRGRCAARCARRRGRAIRPHAARTASSSRASTRPTRSTIRTSSFTCAATASIATTLPRDCPGLERENRISYKRRAAAVCAASTRSRCSSSSGVGLPPRLHVPARGVRAPVARGGRGSRAARGRQDRGEPSDASSIETSEVEAAERGEPADEPAAAEARARRRTDDDD